MEPTRHHRTYQICLIVMLGLALLLPGTAAIPLVDRDEPRFAQATVEMIERDEWFVPYFNGDYRFDKPVMTYWLMRAGYAIFGIGELGARFHSIVSTILIGLAVFWAGRRWFSAGVGFYAAAGLLTCLQFILNGRSCVADMPMVLAVTVAQICLYELLRGDPARVKGSVWMWGLYTALALGFLTKGPIALMVPALTVVLLRFVFWRKPLPWKHLQLHIGIPLMLAIVAAWGVPALIKTDGLFWDVGMGKHVVKRGMEVFNARQYIPVFYLISAFISLFPWIAYAPNGWYVLRRRWEFENRFLISWLAAPYLIFTFYATQLPHYVMPGFGAFFLILAQSLDCPVPTDRRWVRWWFRVVLALPVLIVAAVLVWLAVVPFQAPYADLRDCLWGVVAILAGLTSMALLLRYRHHRWLFAGVVVIAAGVVLLAVGLRRVSPAVQMVPFFKAMPADTECMGYRFTEGTLVFYSQQQWQFTKDPKDVAAFLAGSGPRLIVLLTSEKKLDRYLKWQWHRWQGESVPMKYKDYADIVKKVDTSGYQKKTIQGLNLGRFTWVSLEIYFRFDQRPSQT